MAIQSKMKRQPIGAPKEEKKQLSPWVWVAGIIILIIIGGVWYQSANSSGKDDGEIASGEYQAVFLDNGQVYFGKLSGTNKEFYTLRDVYYLQTGAVGLDANASLSLTKLGNEAHGPEDEMRINKAHILFIEDMKQESKVVGAIKDHKSKQK